MSIRFRPLMLILAFSLLLGSSSSFAVNKKKHPKRAQVNHRQHTQKRRIASGVKSGKLTPAQAKQLKRNQGLIKQQEKNDVKANGGSLTNGEHKQINQELNDSNKEIFQEKHPSTGIDQ